MKEHTRENVISNLKATKISPEDIEKIVNEMDTAEQFTLYVVEDLMTNMGEWNLVTDTSFDVVLGDVCRMLMDDGNLVAKLILMKDPTDGAVYKVPVKGLNGYVSDMRFGLRIL